MVLMTPEQRDKARLDQVKAVAYNLQLKDRAAKRRASARVAALARAVKPHE